VNESIDNTIASTIISKTHQGIWKSVGKIGKEVLFCFREVWFLPKSVKKCNFGPKVQNKEFWPIISYNAFFYQIVLFGAIFVQKCRIAPSHFSRCPDMSSHNMSIKLVWVFAMLATVGSILLKNIGVWFH